MGAAGEAVTEAPFTAAPAGTAAMTCLTPSGAAGRTCKGACTGLYWGIATAFTGLPRALRVGMAPPGVEMPPALGKTKGEALDWET
mmetsp:Transcript_123878/g.344791  ORF Transcript_123878/g.344791 Transcript_123878/m.344791 type:complete len:86 (+) Transcript_123878:419-676(+)